MTRIVCPRCSSLPCRCAYEPTQRFALPLSDADVERIAQRVVELMRKKDTSSGAHE